MAIQKGNIKDIRNYRSIILFSFLLVEFVTVAYATSAGAFFYLLIFALAIPFAIIIKFKLSQLISKAGMFRNSPELFFGATDLTIAIIMFSTRVKGGGLETCFDACSTTPFPGAILSVIFPMLVVVVISTFINLAGYKSGKAKS